MDTPSKSRTYQPKALYTSQAVINQAANRNRVPKSLVFKRVIKISLIIGPLLALLLWLS
jgi:hypothetical protein